MRPPNALLPVANAQPDITAANMNDLADQIIDIGERRDGAFALRLPVHAKLTTALQRSAT